MIISSGRSKVRSTVVVLAATALAVAGSVTDIAAPTRAEASIDGLMAAAAAGVEDEGADCPVNVPGSSASNSKLARSLQEDRRHAHLGEVRLAMPARGNQEAGGEDRLRREAGEARERHRDGLERPASP